MVLIKKQRNQTPKVKIYRQYFYRKRRVVVNPPYHLTADIASIHDIGVMPCGLRVYSFT